jgi:zinc transport system substrate-binding protein
MLIDEASGHAGKNRCSRLLGSVVVNVTGGQMSQAFRRGQGIASCQYFTLLATFGIASGMCAVGAQAEVRIVASSKPVHALVASVMGSTGTPTLLVSGSASPHSYAMKPSDAKAVNAAAVFFRISESLEPFTGKLVKALPKTVRVVSLQDAPGIKALDRREGGAFEEHGGDAHKGHAGHGHGAAKGKAAAAADERDPHVWLDPRNALAMVDQIASVLVEAEPANAATFKANAAATRTQIETLSTELERDLKPIAGKPFVVLHDAYQYLERRFGLTAVGSIAISPETAPSGKRLAAVRKKIADSGAVCVFAEPGMQPKVVAAVIEGSKAKSGMLDPEATQLTPGPNAYEELMRGLARGMRSCFDAK